MTRDIPLRKEIDLALEKRLVIRRQHAGATGALQPDERVAGVAEKRVGVARVKRREIGGRAKIGEQQKAALQILCHDFGNVQTGRPHQRGDLNKRTAVLPLRRRVHHHPRITGDRDPEIPAKAGVLGSRRQRKRIGTEPRCQPFPQQRQAAIGKSVQSIA
ncbi:hypothetical protein D3C83_04370 [compost metagenome]